MTPETKLTYVTLLADPSIHPKYEAALKQVEADLGKHHPMYIDGRKVLVGDSEFDVRSPLDTKILLGYFQKGNGQHARKAIEAGKDAFKEWSEKAWRDRVAVIRKARELMEEERYKLAALITLEVGKNRYEAIAEASEAIDFLGFYTDLMEHNDGYVKPMQPGAPGETSKSVLRPYGVWVVISPFNFPLALATGMVIGALITGNTVVFHPTSAAPLSGLRLYEILIEAGVPPG
ncbi:MAG TPA: aldehyde dehydrogenase family protein, partial [Candidatus Bathyarchaeia archaeon]|nr:aldehyde dehydrogenase family protein [Candidatus Bathyarchaeia archaeon]